jgi:hypothetical protein
MRGITLVQGSIRKKLILTYSTVIFVFLAIIGVLLNITAGDILRRFWRRIFMPKPA